jgi:hypothetical protein
MKVKFTLMESGDPVTRTEAVMLFDHRAAFDMEGCNDYFDLEDIVPPYAIVHRIICCDRTTPTRASFSLARI